MISFTFLLVNNPHEKTKAYDSLMLLTRVVYASQAFQAVLSVSQSSIIVQQLLHMTL